MPEDEKRHDPEPAGRGRGATNRAVFLDRDGVLIRSQLRNGRPVAPWALSQFQLLEGVSGACARLKQAGYLLIVVTNQPDVARGTLRQEVVESINALLRERLPIDDLQVCYHDEADRCSCRKPQPGLIVAASVKWGINLSASFLVGDRWHDIEAGQRAGCRTVFIDYAYREAKPRSPDYRAGSLADAVDWMVLAR